MNILPKQLSAQTINTIATTYSVNPVFLEKDWYTQISALAIRVSRHRVRLVKSF